MERYGDRCRTLVALCAAVVCSACGEAPARIDAVLVDLPADTPCSDLTRTVAKWQGREISVCGPETTRFRALTPLGNGFILGWTPASGVSELWQLTADNTLGTGPLAAFISVSSRNNAVLVVLGNHMLAYSQKTGQMDVTPFNVAVRGVGDIWRPSTTTAASLTQTWFRPGGGRDLIALDANNILDWQPSTGSYSLVRFHPTDMNSIFDRSEMLGKKDEFRRGHRLLALGADRVLEWVPRTRDYRIWHYVLERAPGDIFDPEPESRGTWETLGEQDDILVLASDRIATWHRDTGKLEVRALDPLASDPLAGSALGISQDDRLRSLPPAWERETKSRIRRLVLVFQQGRSFDSYFGHYCQAQPESKPTCEEGPACCEGMPSATAGTERCRPLNPEDDTYVPNQSAACLREKMNGGAMDRFAVSSIAGCGDPRDFACSQPGDARNPIGAYYELAKKGAIADRYFASIADSAELNFIYFVLTGYWPQIAGASFDSLDALTAYAQIPGALYLADPLSTSGQTEPYYYDGHWAYFRYLDELAYDIASEQLPAISIAIAGPDANEAPGRPSSLTDGIAFATRIAKQIAESPRYAEETLVIITHFTSGGFYDHVSPPQPPPITIDPANVPYGPRVPFLALGAGVRPNHVSHVPLEHSSLTRFIEWNWFDGQTGQLGFRDRFVNNLGSLFDPAATGIAVP
jgi:phospholipase C